MKLLLFLLFPILEFYLLIRVGSSIGALNVVLLCLASALAGWWVIKSYSTHITKKIQQGVSLVRSPQEAATEGALIFLAGVLLMIPGFISDTLGILLLIPPVRHLCGARIRQYFSRSSFPGGGGSQSAGRIFFFSSQFSSPGFEPDKEKTPRHATIIDCTPIATDSVASEKKERESGAPAGKEEYDCTVDSSSLSRGARDDDSKGSL